MHLAPNDNAVFRYLRHGKSYERESVEFLKEVCRLNDVSEFFDIGASYGFYSLSLASDLRSRPGVTLHLFEPDPRCYNALLRSIEQSNLRDIMFPNNVIVGEREGSADLLFSDRASTSNRTFQSDGETFSAVRRQTMPVIAIDDYARRKQLGRRAIVVKMDVEGNEVRVFKGCKELLKDAFGYCVLFEFYPAGIKEVGQDRSELMQIMSELAPDRIFKEANSDVRPVSGLPDLFRDMESYSDLPGRRGTGAAVNYIICKNIRVQ